MKRIDTRVCNNFESGTNAKVYIKFQFNRKYCRTADLDTAHVGDVWTNDWGRGDTQVWGHQKLDSGEHNFLGGCRDFQAKDQLKAAQVVIPIGSDAVSEWDDVEICNLKVTFGKKDQPGYSVWEWRGNGKQNGEWK